MKFDLTDRYVLGSCLVCKSNLSKSFSKQVAILI